MSWFFDIGRWVNDFSGKIADKALFKSAWFESGYLYEILALLTYCMLVYAVVSCFFWVMDFVSSFSERKKRVLIRWREGGLVFKIFFVLFWGFWFLWAAMMLLGFVAIIISGGI